MKDHSDAVYGVAFSPDGALLASGSADRAVKVWQVADGKRLYTLSDSTDWVYAVAWSPDGKHLAAAGVDKSVRVWEVSAQGGKLVHAVFAHEAPVVRVAWSADSQTLYSLSEDGTAKAWDAGRMVERIVYAKQPEAPLALAIRPDQKQVAVGRYDGALVLLEEATGKVQGQPLPAKPKPPVLNKATPASAVRGQTVHLRLEGQNLDGATEVTANLAGVKAVVAPGGAGSALDVELTIPADAAPGQFPLTVKTPAGVSGSFPFIVDRFNPVTEVEPNDSPRTAQAIALPTTVVGAIGRAGDVDYYRFEAKAGQEIGVQLLTAAVGSKLEPVLELTDADGRVLTESTNGLLGYTCPAAGTYAVSVRDRDYRGDATMFYRLNIGDIPIVTGLFPLGVQRGAESDVRIEGVHLGPNAHRPRPGAGRRRGRRAGPRAVGHAQRAAARRPVVAGRGVSGGHIDRRRRRAARAVHGQRPYRPARRHDDLSVHREEGATVVAGGQRPPARFAAGLDRRNPRRRRQAAAAGRAPLRGQNLRHLPRPRLGHARHPHRKLERPGGQRLPPCRRGIDADPRVAEEPRRRLPVLRPERPAPRLSRHDADVSSPRPDDVQGVDPSAGYARFRPTACRS